MQSAQRRVGSPTATPQRLQWFSAGSVSAVVLQGQGTVVHMAIMPCYGARVGQEKEAAK